MVEIFIASKHIRERKRQSFIAVLGIAIGVLVMTVSLAVSNGLDKNMIKNILSINENIRVTDYSGNISDYNEVIKKIEGLDGVEAAMAEVYTQGIINYNDGQYKHTQGVIIKGFMHEKAQKILSMEKMIIEGKYILNKNDSILVGSELYKALGANIGDKIMLISAENKEISFTISGVFRSGYYEYDSNLVIIPLVASQVIADIEDTATRINVKLKDINNADPVKKAIIEKTGLGVMTWADINRNIVYSLKFEKTIMIIILSLIILVSGFVVAVVLNMLVSEKTRDIGILRSLGYSGRRIMSVFLLEGLFLGVIGVFTGGILSGAVIAFLKNYVIKIPGDAYYIDRIPAEISITEIVVIILLTLVIVIIAAIQPAYKASGLKTVEALKYE